MNKISRIAVVGGGGTMGSGIVQVAAAAGFAVTMVEQEEAGLERGMERIRRSLSRMVNSNRLTEREAEDTIGRIALTADFEAGLGSADFVFESVIENEEAKHDVLRRADAVCRPSTILASNTSQFAITGLGRRTGRPDRVIGTHWFNPPPIMRLIEVVVGDDTSQQTVAATLALAQQLGKETIVCRRDSQGFVTSRLSLALNLEAARIVGEGLASSDDVNRACILAFNHAMGPLDTLDLGGLDTTVAAADAMAAHFGERFAPPEVLREHVRAGRLGRKSGEGFRPYETAT
jgi:3-hydroxybutyryl-CoA dehydrogenase